MEEDLNGSKKKCIKMKEWCRGLISDTTLDLQSEKMRVHTDM